MPSYRIIVVEHTESPKTGRYVDKVGTYNPRTKERKLDTDRIRHWLSKGAKPSGTVHNMLVTIGVLNEKKINVLPKKSPPKPALTEASGKNESAKEEEAALTLAATEDAGQKTE